ncbi:AAA family ATPase [Helicobacter saguini]|uniref:AAA family ATPase n=1 Tax=Helicobacter saguini TaxID=1548018 RepID=A0A347VSK9_9HELI|nr:AAA domain-containing protein [Helicobacter saguini]MWV62463.1 AAA family ATPase [Helicobacter saguini]MWV66864.1 AAA family ATPase [Helicobacter saguini]MWV69213.1 AAA family ATPase [Helicobacter saguini]MWV71232.1 AAA family ATPase [Helicobacter saguini]TLD93299.1 hypothetical protein LS64_008630 [Helicobacter saguini]
MQKILWKYDVISSDGNVIQAKHNDITCTIYRKAKSPNKDSSKSSNADSINENKDSINDISFSNKMQNIVSLSHSNIIPFHFDEDSNFFYFIVQDFENIKIIESSDFLESKSAYNSWLVVESYQKLNFQKVLDCFLSILDCICFIHNKGYFCGDISLENIYLDSKNNKFLLSFGKKYFLDSMQDASVNNDIKDFALSMLKLYCLCLDIDFSNNIESMFESINHTYDLEDTENEFIVLIKRMLKDSNITLNEIDTEIRKIYNNDYIKKVYEIRCLESTVEHYCEKNGIEMYEFDEDIENRIAGHKAYIRMKYDSKRKYENIEIAINDLLFVCKVDDNYTDESYFFCPRIELPEFKSIEIDKTQQDGLELNEHFVISINGENKYIENRTNVGLLKSKIKYEYRLKELENKANAIDIESIKTEEDLLVAEYKTIQIKKNTKKARFIDNKRGAETLTFELIESKDSKDSVEYDENIESSDFAINKTQKDSKRRDFKPKDKVIIQYENENEKTEGIKGVIETYNNKNKHLTIKIDSKATHIDYRKDIKYSISYDFQVEEILWNKKNGALESLKSGMVQIPNLLRKINDPTQLKENVLVDIESYFNAALDDNQKEAVRKALSLDTESEILLIQGPPGTGKTTTITEMILQLLHRHKHYRILVASQSNQAVDNVLEKLANDSFINQKILRIGNDNKKISKVGQEFIEIKVLDKIIKENMDRIAKNPILDSKNAKNLSENIKEKLANLQYEFKGSLQTISSKLSQNPEVLISKESHTATLFLKNIRLIFGTLLGISSWKDFRNIVFDVAIVDEAGRAILSEILVPNIKARKIILVGDHKQLSPVVDDEIIENLSEFAKNKDLKHNKKDVTTSLFERLYTRMEKASENKEYIKNFYHRLTYNYRAEPRICDIYSNAFYDGELVSSDLATYDRDHNLKCFKSSVVWLDTGKLPNKNDEQQGTGKINRKHADIIKETLNTLKNKSNLESSNIKDIGIITPYKNQMQLLQKNLASMIKEYDSINVKIDIGTVDSFQGSDRDLIIYDCVRSDKAKNDKAAQKKRQGSKINFIADEKRLNVSLSRSKRLLIIVGDMEFLESASVSEGENPFKDIIEFIRKNMEKYQIIELR